MTEQQVLNEALDDYIRKVEGNIEYCQGGSTTEDASETQRQNFHEMLLRQQERLKIAKSLKGGD